MDAGEVLAVRDRRTIVRRLGEIGVPVTRLGSRLYYDEDRLQEALRDRVGPVPPQWRGTVLPAGYRLSGS